MVRRQHLIGADDMGVKQSFGPDAKSWIDGVEVTEENYEELVAMNSPPTCSILSLNTVLSS